MLLEDKRLNIIKGEIFVFENNMLNEDMLNAKHIKQ